MSLFVCPKCHFEDLPIWKSCHWLRYSVYANRSEVETFLPSLLIQLEASEDRWIFESPYYYKLTRKGNIIYRMTQMGKDEFRTHGFTEKRKDPFQTKLEGHDGHE